MNATCNNCSVTFAVGSGSRFGDCLVTYIKAKWIAHYYNIPFFFQPFAYSNRLAAHSLEKWASFNKKQKKKLDFYTDVSSQKQPTAFIVHLHTKMKDIDVFERIVHDKSFGAEVKKMLAPVVPINWLKLPSDKITVAVHIRKGSGGDMPLYSQQEYEGHQGSVIYTEKLLYRKAYSDKKWPIKFPPNQFYIDQIKKLAELCDYKPMYVYIFTDYAYPEVLLKKISDGVGLPTIEYDSHAKHTYSTTFIDDFYTMARFDCLIRPGSGFSRACQLYGDHWISMYPTKATWKENRLIIDTVEIVRTTDTIKKKSQKKRCILLPKK